MHLEKKKEFHREAFLVCVFTGALYTAKSHLQVQKRKEKK